MEERKIVETSRKIATRNLEMSINENDGFNKTAWIMENGEPFCNHCDSNFVPERVSVKMACSNCGCGRPNDDHGVLDTDFETQDQMDGVVASHELPMDVKSDGMVGSDMVKVAPDNEVTPYTGTTSASRLATTEDYLELFKTSSDSDLYVKGYMDAMNSKPLDTELAEVSDDYFHGYQQYQFYHTSPQEKAPQNLYDIKPNSNQLPRTMDVGTQEELMGPNELTNRHNEVVGSRLPFPSDVVQKFFNEA